MTENTPSRQAGFSLVELLVAMVITMIVTGAIYGVLSGGQSAFKVQPERSDIQQNVRSAMDMIMRDISSAGVDMPPFIQTFTPGLDATGGSPMGSIPNPVAPQQADELEIVTNQENFAKLDVCANAPSPFLKGSPPNLTFPKGVLVRTAGDAAYPPQWAAQQIVAVGGNGIAGACTAGAHPSFTFASGGACTLGAAPTFGSTNLAAAACNVDGYVFGAVVHYRIRPDPLDGMPALWRLSTANLAAGYQIVARGIDDLQVWYVQFASPAGTCTVAAPCSGAPAVSQALTPLAVDYGTLITQVRVSLSARSTLRGAIQGQSTQAGVTALRSQLTSTGTPRTALFALNQQNTGTPQWK
jgi:prepilin-type N-terminal cleavage/methylation domain-containing protein